MVWQNTLLVIPMSGLNWNWPFPPSLYSAVTVLQLFTPSPLVKASFTHISKIWPAIGALLFEKITIFLLFMTPTLKQNRHSKEKIHDEARSTTYWCAFRTYEIRVKIGSLIVFSPLFPVCQKILMNWVRSHFWSAFWVLLCKLFSLIQHLPATKRIFTLCSYLQKRRIGVCRL